MRTSVTAIALVCLVSISGAASAAGCLKGAAVGGVGGHLLGKHAVIGAAAGCAVGTHEANKKARENSDKQAAQTTTPPATEKSH